MPEDAEYSLYPLDACCARFGDAVPEATFIAGEDMPEPYRSLLVHDRDMTGTLVSHHRDTLRLDILRSWEEGDAVLREVLLRKAGDGAVVEYGAIKIHLDRFPREAIPHVRSGECPLGVILNAFQIEYGSRPRGFFRAMCTSHFRDMFPDSLGKETYGRTNQLVNGEGQILADVTELLPP